MTEGDQTPKRIVVALPPADAGGAPLAEGSRGRRFLDQVLWLAKGVGAEVELLHVVVGDDAARRSAAESLVAAAEEIARAAGVPASTRIRHGDIPSEIISEVQDHDADMIALTPRPRPRLTLFGGKKNAGPVIRKVVRESRADVWVVAPPLQTGLSRVLIPVGISELGNDCIDLGQTIRRIADAELYLLHTIHFPDDINLSREADAEQELKAYHSKLRRKTIRELVEMAGEDRARHYLNVCEIPLGAAIPAIVEEKTIDMVILGHAPSSRLVSFLMGDSADDVVNRLHTSVWFLKSND